jgi:hypothetical protein
MFSWEAATVVPEVPNPPVSLEEAQTLSEPPTPATLSEPINLTQYPTGEKPQDQIELGSDHSSSQQYRFGRSSSKVKDKIVDFITTCVADDAGRFRVSPEDGARMTRITDKLRDVFLDHLHRLDIRGEPLIYLENEKWYSSVGQKEMISYATEIVS